MDFLILRPLPPKNGYHFFEGGVGGGWAAAAAPNSPDRGSNRRPKALRPAALPLGHCLVLDAKPPCCFVPHLPLTKNPNCVFLSDCLLAWLGTDWLTVNLSSRCTAEGNRISRSIFRPLCETNPVRNLLVRKIPGAKSPPPCILSLGVQLFPLCCHSHVGRDYGLVQATVGIGTALIWDFCVAWTGGGGLSGSIPLVLGG